MTEDDFNFLIIVADVGWLHAAAFECWRVNKILLGVIVTDDKIDSMLREIHRICKDGDIESGLPLYDDYYLELIRKVVRRYLDEEP